MAEILWKTEEKTTNKNVEGKWGETFSNKEKWAKLEKKIIKGRKEEIIKGMREGMWMDWQ